MTKERNSVTVETSENKIFLLTDRVRTPMSLQGAKLLVELLQENIAILERLGFDDDPTAMRERLLVEVLLHNCYIGKATALCNSKTEKLHRFICDHDKIDVINDIESIFGVNVMIDDLPLMTLDELAAKVIKERKK